MTTRSTLRDTLRPVGRRLRREGGAAVAGIVVGVVPAVLVAAWAVGRWGLRGPGPLLLLAAAGAAALGVVVWLGRRWVRAVDEAVVAAAVERSRGLTEGSLRGVLELERGLPTGVSAALLRRSETDLARRLEGAAGVELAGDLGTSARRRLVRVAVGVLALGLLTAALGFGAPDRARAAWTPLLTPVTHLRGPSLPPVRVTPGDTAVERGSVVTVRVDAALRSGVRVHWRSVGRVPRERTIELEEGRGSLGIGPVDAPTRYWVRAPDGAATDTFTIAPTDPLLIAALQLDLTYPPYLDRAPDHVRGEVPALRVPEGTRLTVEGAATRPLRAAALTREGDVHHAAVDGAAFRLSLGLAPSATGQWSWRLEDAAGRSVEGAAVLDLVVVPDEAPGVRITVPGADTVMPRTRRVPLAAVATDDHGVAAAEVVFRRVGPGGAPAEAVRAPLRLDGRGGRSVAAGVLDASSLPLAPGDEVEYHVAVRDNSPAGRTGRSATYRLRLPDLADLRDRARETASSAVESMSRLADEARELEARTRAASRSAGSRGEAGRRGGEPGGGDPRSLGYESANEAREVLKGHEALLEEVAELRDRLEALDRAVEEAGLRDAELQRRLDELRTRMEELADPALEAAMDRLREAGDALDAAAVEAALEELAARQESLREQVERSLEAMRRAAAEQELIGLAREAEEIAARQSALAEALAESEQPEPEQRASADDREEGGEGEKKAEGAEGAEGAGDERAGSESGAPTRSLDERADQQAELEERASALSGLLQSLEQRLLQLGEEESSTRTGSARQQGEASREAMGEAGERARRQEGGRAAESGRRAAESMARAASELDEARERMSAEQAAQARETVRQATRDALELAERQESIRQAMTDAAGRGSAAAGAQELAAEESALRQGLEQMARNLSEAGRRSAMVDPAVRRALERSRLNMDRTQAGLAEGGMPVSEAERAVESLNQLALSLLENEAGMQRAQSGAGLEAALRGLAEAAREQGSINGELSALAPMRLGERAMTQQLGDAARRQRGVGRRLGELSGMLGGRDDVLGQLDQLSTEAERIARELEGGRLEPEVRARQERLFHRLLDAGRTLEREEYSDERVREVPEAGNVAAPAGLDPALLDGGVRYPAPTDGQLEGLPPAYRRMILEYFRRLNERAGGGGDR